MPWATRAAAGGLAFMLLLAGCGQGPSRGDSKKWPMPVSELRNGKIVLGSPCLTAGIPGTGPLKIDEIRQWLARPDAHQPLDFVLPIGLIDASPLVVLPSENPLTRAKIELGRQLFFDTRLSEASTMACATCHMPEQSYSAHARMPVGKLNPPVCFNRILSSLQSWDGHNDSLDRQAAGPITIPFEMGTSAEDCVKRLTAIEGYRLQFEAIFGKLDADSIGDALASFQRVLVTGPAPWDYRRLLTKYEGRDAESLSAEERELVAAVRKGAKEHPMSPAALRGEALFFSERTRCGVCHSGPNLTDEAFYNVGAGMDAVDPEPGRSKVTGRSEDFGAFKTPTLRNVAETFPYMHNGQLSSLEDVIEWFDRGGFVHPKLDRQIRPLNLTREEKRDLVAFHEALTGSLPPVETGRLPE